MSNISEVSERVVWSARGVHALVMEEYGWKPLDQATMIRREIAQQYNDLPATEKDKIAHTMNEVYSAYSLYENDRGQTFAIHEAVHPVVARLTVKHVNQSMEDWPIPEGTHVRFGIQSAPIRFPNQKGTATAVTLSVENNVTIAYHADSMIPNRYPSKGWMSGDYDHTTADEFVKHIVEHEWAHAHDTAQLNGDKTSVLGRAYTDPWPQPTGHGTYKSDYKSETFKNRQPEIARALGEYAQSNPQETFAELRAWHKMGYGADVPDRDIRKKAASEFWPDGK